MLKPAELFVGSLEHAEPLTFVLPRASYEQRALVFMANDKKLGFMLDGDERVLHHVAECKNEDGWRGILVPNVEIEVDPDSVFDIEGHYPPKGSLVRLGEVLAVQTAYLGNRMAHQGGTMTLIAGLPACEANQRACFTKWQIVLGHGVAKRILHTVNVKLG